MVSGLAQYLHDLGLVHYDPEGTSGDCFEETMPAEPAEAVAIFSTGGLPASPRLGYDTVTVQIMVRGTSDPRTARERAWAIYHALHGLRYVNLPDGTEVLWITAQHPPEWLQTDENGRHLFAINVQLEIRAAVLGRRE